MYECWGLFRLNDVQHDLLVVVGLAAYKFLWRRRLLQILNQLLSLNDRLLFFLPRLAHGAMGLTASLGWLGTGQDLDLNQLLFTMTRL